MINSYDSALGRAIKSRITAIIQERTEHLVMKRATSYDDYLGRCHEISSLSALLGIIDGIEEQLNDVGAQSPVLATGRKK
jgi:hypothetical protein